MPAAVERDEDKERDREARDHDRSKGKAPPSKGMLAPISLFARYSRPEGTVMHPLQQLNNSVLRIADYSAFSLRSRQGRLPCSLQVLQGGILHCGLFMPFLSYRNGPRTEGCLCVVRKGELQVLSQVRAGPHFAWPAHEHGQEEQEGCPDG